MSRPASRPGPPSSFSRSSSTASSGVRNRSASMNAVVEFRKVDIIFGAKRKQALALLDAGAARERILAETGCVLGAADINLTVKRGEICVLMGLSGSGKSTVLRAVNRLN